VIRLARAFERLGEGSLTFAGDGPLRGELESRENVRLLGAVPYERIPRVIADAHVVCQPSLVEPFGQALLEGMACGRSVVATKVGGPPEFVPPEGGVLVDPLDEAGLAEALRVAADLPRPNPAARAAAERHDVNEQARRVEAILERAARAPQAEARRAV
jgi:glycosyltransferase involved in cell wall biosynthesis